MRPLLDFPAGLRPQAQGHRVKTWRARAEWKPGPFLLIAEVRLGASSGQSRSLQRHGPGVRSARLLSCAVLSRRWVREPWGQDTTGLCQNPGHPGKWQKFLAQEKGSFCSVSLVLRAPFPSGLRLRALAGPRAPLALGSQAPHVIPELDRKAALGRTPPLLPMAAQLWLGSTRPREASGALGLPRPDLLLLPGEGARTRPKARGPGAAQGGPWPGLGSNRAASSSPAQTWRPPESRSLHFLYPTSQAPAEGGRGGGCVWGEGTGAERLPPVPVSGASKASGHTSCPFAGGALDFPGHGPGPCSRLYAPATPPQEGTAQGPRGWRLADLFLLMAASHQKQQPASPQSSPSALR